MPFRRAPYFILAMIVVTVFAFWPRYFAVLNAAPWSLHFHAVAATAWMVVVGLQAWSGTHRRLALHRTLGIGTLALFPVFLASMVAVILSMAQSTPTDAFYAVNGARLGLFDAISPFVIAWLYYRALATRRAMQQHARYMLAIPLLLVEPVVERLAGRFIPMLSLHGPEDFDRFVWTLLFSNAVALAFTGGLFATAPRYGRPFLLVGVVMALQTLLFLTLGSTAEWRSLFITFGSWDALPVLAITALGGAAISLLGWEVGSGTRPATAHVGR